MGAAHVLMASQHGAAGSRQLRQLGISERAERLCVASGMWRRETDAVVVAAASPSTAHRAAMVAVLDVGEVAVASHELAAWVWRLPGFRSGAVDVTTLRGTTRRRRAPVRLHEPRLLLPHHVTIVDGVPVTSLARTLFDLAGVPLHPKRMARLLDNVITQSPAMAGVLAETLRELARRGRPGISLMRELLAERPPGVAVPATNLERRFEEILASAGLPAPRRQVDVGGQAWIGRVDFRDVEFPILYEVDSRRHHTGLLDAQADRVRDEAMLAAGWWEVVRICEDDIWHRPWVVVAQVRAARQRAKLRSGCGSRPESAVIRSQNEEGATPAA
jgi:very-short-patch-repair endonuclease